LGSASKEKFTALYNKAYSCLRQHTNIIMLMLMLLIHSSPKIDEGEFKFDEAMLHDEILKRFLPGEDEEDASAHLIAHVESSKQSYSTVISDFAHYHKSQATLSAIGTSAYNFGYNALSAAVGAFSGAVSGAGSMWGLWGDPTQQ